MKNWTVALFGPPGVGKTTLGRDLEATLGCYYCSLGELIRKEISQATDFGKKIEEAQFTRLPYEVGLLTNIVESYIRRSANPRLILDGYPKNPDEVDDAIGLCERQGVGITHILHVHLPKEEVLRRSLVRMVCGECQFPTSQSSELCPQCGSANLRGRHLEDNTEDFERRYKNYQIWTPVIMEALRPNRRVKSIGLVNPRAAKQEIAAWLDM